MPGGNNNNSKNQQSLKDLVNVLQKKVDELESKNTALEERIVHLEQKQITSTHVTKLLTEGVDRLGQYHRRSNVMMRGVFLPEKESNEEVENKVKRIIKDEMGIPEVIGDFDKAHRICNVKEINGKKHQDIIVKFKSHAARYKVYNGRKSLKNRKINPNLTKKRGKLMYDARLIIENIEKVHFIFADIHGDLQMRLKDPYKGKHFFEFNSIESLNDLLKEMGLFNE